MRSLTAGLARQAMVAGTMGVLLIAALTASPNVDHRVLTASAAFDKPIPTRAIVIADAAPPAPAPQPARAVAAKPSLAAPKPMATHVHLAASEATPRPRPAERAPQATAAANVPPENVPADPPAEPRFDLRKRLFAPVSFVRDNVARLMSWP